MAMSGVVDIVIPVSRAADLFLTHDHIRFAFYPVGLRNIVPFIIDIASFTARSLGSNDLLSRA